MGEAETYHKSENDDDLLPVVNDANIVTGSASRREIHLRKLLHRSVHIVVLNDRSQVLLQLRSHKKDSHPGWWDISVGGHVDVGETYDKAAKRELKEELGFVAPYRFIARREASAESGWEFVNIYECACRSEPDFNRDEIDDVRWVSAVKLLTHGHSNPENDEWRITGSGLLSFRAWAAARGIQ